MVLHSIQYVRLRRQLSTRKVDTNRQFVYQLVTKMQTNTENRNSQRKVEENKKHQSGHGAKNAEHSQLKIYRRNK